MKHRLASHLLLPVLFMLYAFADASGQSRFHVWHFGEKATLDFKTDPPTILSLGLDTALEGTASITDCKTGEVLFYTNGITIFNRLNKPMLNGENLISDVSSTQAALIVPDPGDELRYYVFTTDQAGYATDPSGNLLPHRGMYLHMVDMRGDNGLGAVVEKNIQLLSRCAEKLTGIYLKDENAYWVIAHDLTGDAFNAWKISSAGYAGPIRSNAGTSFFADRHSAGALVASPDGTMLASMLSRSDAAELLSFDKLTGEVSFITALPTVNSAYGASFSPNGSKLYIAGLRGELIQVDLKSLTLNDLVRSKFVLTNRASGMIQQGPDEKLYVRSYANFDNYIGIIHQPNESKKACLYDSVALKVPMVSSARDHGLPNIIVGLYEQVCSPPFAKRLTPQEICEQNCITFSDSSRQVSAWQWRFTGGNPATSAGKVAKVCYEKPGTYDVELIVSNTQGHDTVMSTVTVLSCPRPVVALRDTIICAGECVTFIDTSSVATTHLWTGDGGSGLPSSARSVSVCYSKLGKYKINLISSNEFGSDTAECFVTVVDCENPVSVFAHDTLICVGDSVIYTDHSLNATSWSWRFGSGTPSTSDKQLPGPIAYTKAGRYQTRLIVSNGSEFDTAYSNVTVWDCAPPKTELLNFSICEGDCIDLKDRSSNYPETWLWTFDGGTPSTSTIRDPGNICYNTAGEYSISLIVANAYGADTALAQVTVLSAEGRISPSVLALSTDLNTCWSLDTSVWIYSGCQSLNYQLLDPGNSDVTVQPQDAVLNANDSLRVQVRVAPKTVGAVSTSIQVSLNAESVSIPVTYNVVATGGMQASPTSINFGETNICEERDSVVRLTNNGCDTLTVTGADVDKNFSVGGDYPIVLAPGESIDVPITTIVDTAGKPTVLTGSLTITSTADNQVAPITLIRILYYPMKLRIEAVDDASGTAGDVVKFRVLLEGQVPSTMTALHFDFLHNGDLLSWDEYDGVGLNRTNISGDEQQRSSFTLSPVHDGVVGEFSFRTNLALAEQTTLSFDNITFEAAGVTFAPECIAVISDSGSRFNYVYTCGDNIIRDRLNGTRLIKSITPNPASGEIRVELSVGQAKITLIDALGKERVRTTEARIDVRDLPNGVYYVRVASAGSVETRRVVISR